MPLALATVGDTLVAGHNPGGLHWSGDLGVSWTKGMAEGRAAGPLAPSSIDDFSELATEAPVWALGADDTLVFAGASAGIYSSQDRGHTWTRARNGLPENSPGIAFLLTPDLILAGTLVSAKHSPSAIRASAE